MKTINIETQEDRYCYGKYLIGKFGSAILAAAVVDEMIAACDVVQSGDCEFIEKLHQTKQAIFVQF